MKRLLSFSTTVLLLATLAVATCALVGCVDEASTPDVAPVPDYKVVKIKDVSFATARRLVVRVSLPQHYSRDGVEQVAHAVVADITKSQAVNAICIFMYGPGTWTDGFYDVAKVDWAPNGRWEDADSVKAGDYSSFAYSVSYIAPAPARATSLKRSGKTGLLGVPLPAGATLVEDYPGNPGRADPAQKYAISGTSRADIAAFFDEGMAAAGWKKGGDSIELETWRTWVLYFDKGSLMIQVMIDRDGGTFMVRGS